MESHKFEFAVGPVRHLCAEEVMQRAWNNKETNFDVACTHDKHGRYTVTMLPTQDLLLSVPPYIQEAYEAVTSEVRAIAKKLELDSKLNALSNDVREEMQEPLFDCIGKHLAKYDISPDDVNVNLTIEAV